VFLAVVQRDNDVVLTGHKHHASRRQKTPAPATRAAGASMLICGLGHLDAAFADANRRQAGILQ
jgi:hypothetical protein